MERPDSEECHAHSMDSAANAVGASIVREQQPVRKEEIQREEERKRQMELKAAKQTQENETTDEEVLEGGSLEHQGMPPLAAQATEQRRQIGKSVEIEAGRKMKVIVLEMKEWPETEDIEVHLTDNSTIALVFAGWLPLVLTIVVMIICGLLKEWFVCFVILLGTVGMMLAVYGLRTFFVFKHSIPKPAQGAPKGDCVVIDERNPNVFHIIEAEEKNIQALLQMKIVNKAKPGGKLMLLLAGSLLYAYVIISVLFMPSVSFHGLLLFAGANVIGLFFDMLKASRNARLGLARKACEQFAVEFKGSLRFLNRTSAVAFVAKHADDCRMLKSKKFLPCDGPVWNEWWYGLWVETGRRRVSDKNEETLKQQLREYRQQGLKASLPDNPGPSDSKARSRGNCC